jgi:hypothetical protein
MGAVLQEQFGRRPQDLQSGRPAPADRPTRRHRNSPGRKRSAEWHTACRPLAWESYETTGVTPQGCASARREGAAARPGTRDIRARDLLLHGPGLGEANWPSGWQRHRRQARRDRPRQPARPGPKVQAPASGGAGLAAGQNVAPAASAPREACASLGLRARVLARGHSLLRSAAPLSQGHAALPVSSSTTPRSFSWPKTGPAVGHAQGGRVWLFCGHDIRAADATRESPPSLRSPRAQVID